MSTFLTNLILMVLLTGRFSFTRILSLGHILWVPMLAFFFTQVVSIPANNYFGVLIRAILLLSRTSLALDGVDMVRHIVGDRKETVPGS